MILAYVILEVLIAVLHSLAILAMQILIRANELVHYLIRVQLDALDMDHAHLNVFRLILVPQDVLDMVHAILGAIQVFVPQDVRGVEYAILFVHPLMLAIRDVHHTILPFAVMDAIVVVVEE